MTTQLATLAQVKEYIGNSADATDDALLTRLIDAASELIERSCSRVFGSASYTESRDGNGGNFIVLNYRPIISISSVTVDGKTIPQSAGPTLAGWVQGSPWKISLRGQYAFTEGVQNVALAYTAGFATIPADLVQSCCLLVGLGYKERDRLGLTSKGVGGESISFSSDDLPDPVSRTVNNYRNWYLA